MHHISNEFVRKHLNYRELISLLEEAYISAEIKTATKSLNAFGDQLQNGVMSMSAWNSEYVGTKLLMIMPDNPNQGLPAIRGLYTLNHAKSGEVLCTIDAEEMTSIRTACASALAASKLARQDSKSLLVLGNGALAKHMIIAHAEVRPLEQIYIWGRNDGKSEQVKASLDDELRTKVTVISSFEDSIEGIDIISAATGAQSPIIHKRHISKGQHIDLVGSYKPDMQELDERVLGMASVYADDLKNTPKKAGEFCKAFENEIMSMDDIKGDLKTISSSPFLRETAEEITVFKSSGMAIQDLVSAQLLYIKAKTL